MLHPTFPTVEGRYEITKNWAVTLPDRFNRRIEDRSLVLWRPGITAWIVVWGDDKAQTPHETLDWLCSDLSPEAFDSQIETDGDIIRYACRLTEHRQEGVVHALYAFAIGAGSHVQMAIYFNDQCDLETARSMCRSLDETRLA